jgi:predicted alpha/beta-hydrolase family hydrolase
MDILTAAGPAHAQVEAPPKPEFLLVLTHGAGGGVQTKDLVAAGQGGLTAGAVVARILQPYRVRGARAPGSPVRQDAAWLEIISYLRARYPGLPDRVGGRRAGRDRPGIPVAPTGQGRRSRAIPSRRAAGSRRSRARHQR